jgi:hypothetical protein
MKLGKSFIRLLFATAIFVFGGSTHGEIYQWKDDAGQVHYSDKKPATVAKVYQLPPTHLDLITY